MPLDKQDILTQAIQSVAVGKKGSRSLTSQQVSELIENISSKETDPLRQAVLCTALLFKGSNKDERRLLEKILRQQEIESELLMRSFCPDIDQNIFVIIKRLLDHNKISYQEISQLGDFFFDTERYKSDQDDHARAIGATWLRVRYASDQEYLALYRAFSLRIEKSFSYPLAVDKKKNTDC